MDVFSALVTLIAMCAFTWMFAEKVIGTRADHVGTFDMRQPVWVYYFVAWIGLAAAVLLMVARTDPAGVLAGKAGARPTCKPVD